MAKKKKKVIRVIDEFTSKTEKERIQNVLNILIKYINSDSNNLD